jgi:hypothetical protein
MATFHLYWWKKTSGAFLALILPQADIEELLTFSELFGKIQKSLTGFELMLDMGKWLTVNGFYLGKGTPTLPRRVSLLHILRFILTFLNRILHKTIF